MRFETQSASSEVLTSNVYVCPCPFLCQVEVEISRKWRNLTVVLKCVTDEIESFPYDIRTDVVTVAARHKTLSKITTSGRTKQGAAELPGADALYVGMTYRLEVIETEHVSSSTTEVVVMPGSSPLLVKLPVGPAAGRRFVRSRQRAERDSGRDRGA